MMNSFEYNHGTNKLTKVQFDIHFKNGEKQAFNITVTSNWRVHYPKNPEINTNERGEYGFFENTVFSTDGDTKLLIKRIHKIIEESK